MPSKLKEYKDGEAPKLHRVHIAMDRKLFFGEWTEEKKKLADKLGKKISNGQYAEYLLLRNIKKQEIYKTQKTSCL